MRRFLMVLSVLLAIAVLPGHVRAQEGGGSGGGSGGGKAPVQTENDRAVVAEADFIARMLKDAKGDEGEGRGGDKGGSKGGDAGARPAAKKEEQAEESEGVEEEEEEEAGAGDGDEEEDRGAAAGAEEEEKGAAGAEAEGDEEGAGAGAEEGAEAGAEEEEGDEEGAGETIKGALKRHGAKLSLEDLPEEARPLVEQRLRQFEAPFTRAMQEATAFRQERASLTAELRYVKENLVDFVVEELLKDPTKGEAINAKLEEIGGSETNRKAHEVVVKDRRGEILKAEQGEAAKAEQRTQRGEQVEAYAMRAAEQAGVPFGLGVEDAVASHVLEHGDITREDIDRIVAAKATELRNATRGGRRQQSKEYVQNKLKDRKTAGLKVKPGSGASPAPGKGKAPKTDAEFMEHMEANLAARGM